MGRASSALASEPVPAAFGVVHDLLRIRNSQDRQRRSRVAQSDGDGRVLSKRTAANLDRLVCATSAALVSHGNSCSHLGAGVGDYLDGVVAPPISHRAVLVGNALTDWN